MSNSTNPLQLPEGIDFIGDFNEYGIENVPSQEHDPGFGCVPYPSSNYLPLLLQVATTPDEAEQWMWTEYHRTERERQDIEDAHLARHGIY